MTEKIDMGDLENGRHFDHAMNNGNGAPLTRETTTMTLSNEQYERLFFQPNKPRHGDFAKRFANPSLLGLIGFLIPYTSTILTLCQFQGALPPYSLVGLSADYYFLGSIAMVIAGIGEFILGNTFPFCVFIIYGTHWGSLAYTQDPIHGIATFFENYGGATGAPYNSSQSFHNITMAMVSFVLMIGCLRVNVLFVLLFFGLVMLFSFIAAADAAVPNATDLAGEAHILKLLQIGGGFGFIGLVCGWYLAILEVCEAVQIPCPLPVFDLAGKIFPAKKTATE